MPLFRRRWLGGSLPLHDLRSSAFHRVSPPTPPALFALRGFARASFLLPHRSYFYVLYAPLGIGNVFRQAVLFVLRPSLRWAKRCLRVEAASVIHHPGALGFHCALALIKFSISARSLICFWFLSLMP